MWTHTGSKYEISRDAVAVAKLIRADIKAAIKERKLPKNLKTRVKTDRYSGGSSLDVVVTDGVDGCFNPLYWEHLNTHPYLHNERPSRYTVEGNTLLATLNEICAAYQYVNSDSMTDYHHTNFYLGVKFDDTIEVASCTVAA